MTVHVGDGRVLTGEVDARTDEEHLWLRFTYPSIALSSSFAWDQIAGVRLGGEVFSAEQFRGRATELASELPEDFFKRPKTKLEGQKGIPPGADRMLPDTWRHGAQQRRIRPRVQSLHIYAFVANWDSDAETDGLELHVLPQSAEGTVVPVDGQLRITLVGRHYRPSGRGGTFPELERSSHRVRCEDFGPWGAVYRLPFRQIKPDSDLHIGSDALVTASLSVFSEGSFEATAPVRLRTYNPLREQN